MLPSTLGSSKWSHRHLQGRYFETSVDFYQTSDSTCLARHALTSAQNCTQRLAPHRTAAGNKLDCEDPQGLSADKTTDISDDITQANTKPPIACLSAC